MSFRNSLFRWPAIAVAITLIGAAEAGCQSDTQRTPSPPASPQGAARESLALPMPAPMAPVTASAADQRALMRKSAHTAWAYVSRTMSPAGFAPALEVYAYTTVWDLASTLASIYSARELGFINQAEYTAAVDRALATLERMPLYDGGAYNKLYDSRNGAMVDRKTQKSKTGYGWSVLDHGRLLIWLRLVSQGRDTAFASRAQAIVNRLDMSRMLKGGYLQGQDIDPDHGTIELYQEGRIGYEQYAAEGFALWNARAENALSFAVNGTPVQVNGQTVLADKRTGDLLTSEPFVMMGLELGWRGEHWKPLALSVLAAQEARYRKTGTLTMVSEDAVPDPPAYFYYYLLYADGKTFPVLSPGGTANSSFPRWLSAKAAFGYHALAPSDYTWKTVQAVQYGSTMDRGWTAGVYEGTQKATKAFNLNTAAVVLEAAAYAQRGCPFIQTSCDPAAQH